MTGASKGMGKAIAIAMADHGATVITSSRALDHNKGADMVLGKAPPKPGTL